MEQFAKGEVVSKTKYNLGSKEFILQYRVDTVFILIEFTTMIFFSIVEIDSKFSSTYNHKR